MKRDDLMNALTEKGVRVCGTTRDFGIGGEEGIWIAADSPSSITKEYIFDYWNPKWYNTFRAEPKLNSFVEKNGWYFEWFDPGTMMCYPQY